jgi:hypothetical protein
MCSEGDAVLVKPAGAHRKEVRIIRKGLSDFTIHKGIISPGQEAFATGMIGGEAIGV